jgi:hypothetical protein
MRGVGHVKTAVETAAEKAADRSLMQSGSLYSASTPAGRLARSLSKSFTEESAGIIGIAFHEKREGSTA